MDKASKPTENQNRGAVATGWVLKFFQRLSMVASILLLSPWPVATSPGSDFVTNRMKFESNCIST
jgi:hypothetical protein